MPHTAEPPAAPAASARASLAQKLIGRACGREDLRLGQSVSCRIDLALLDDVGAPAAPAALWRDRQLVPWDRRRVVAVLESAGRDDPLEGRADLPHVYRGLGIASLVLAQAAHLRPGMVLATGQGRSSVAGAFGVLTLGLDSAALRAALACGEQSLAVPSTMFVRWTGRLADGVAAHDMVLHLQSCLDLPAGVLPWVLEFCGEAVAALPMGDRMSLSALSTALGAAAGLIAPDRVARDWLLDAGVPFDEIDIAPWRSDEDAPGVRHAYDASSLTPQVALPAVDGLPQSAHVHPLADLDPTRIDMACLGGVEGAKLDDLRAAARVLAGYRIASGVQLMVAPASRLDREIAAREGILRRLVEAGATVLPAPRIDGWAVPDSTVVSSCMQPFVGRAGKPDSAPVLRASPFTVAASALRGQLSDAREVLG